MKTSSWLGLGLITTWASLSLIPLSADPEWWSDGNPPVIEPGAPENNRGPANIGQAKWMVSEALRALGDVDPVAAGEIGDRLTQAQPHPTDPNVTLPPILSLEPPPPAERDQAWKDKQRAPLLIGQLKAMSAPFYEVLHTRHPVWLTAQRAANQTQDSANPQNIYPWTATPTDDENRAIANIGQLKAVFALSFEDIAEGPLDSDGDGLPDEWEIAHGLDPNTSGDQNNSFQGGATTNGQAFNSGVQADPNASLVDKDGDGVLDEYDAVPADKLIDWKKSPHPRFVMIPLRNLSATAISSPVYPTGLNNEGRMVGWTMSGADHQPLYFNGQDWIEIPMPNISTTGGEGNHNYEAVSLRGSGWSKIDDLGYAYAEVQFTSDHEDAYPVNISRICRYRPETGIELAPLDSPGDFSPHVAGGSASLGYRLTPYSGIGGSVVIEAGNVSKSFAYEQASEAVTLQSVDSNAKFALYRPTSQESELWELSGDGFSQTLVTSHTLYDSVDVPPGPGARVNPQSMRTVAVGSGAMFVRKTDGQSYSKVSVDSFSAGSNPWYGLNVSKQGWVLGNHGGAGAIGIWCNGSVMAWEEVVNLAPGDGVSLIQQMNEEGMCVGTSVVDGLYQGIVLLPIDIEGYTRGTINAPGQRVPRGSGEYGQETVMLENGDSESAENSTEPDHTLEGNLSEYRMENDNDLVKLVLRWPKDVIIEGARLELRPRGLEMDPRETEDESRYVENDTPRLKFFKPDGTRLTETDLVIENMGSPGDGYLSEILDTGELTLFVEGAEMFGGIDPYLAPRDGFHEEDSQALTQARDAAQKLGGAILNFQFTYGGTNSRTRLLIYRGGYLHFRMPTTAIPLPRGGVLGTLEFRDGKGRVSATEVNEGNVLFSWSARSGRRNGMAYNETKGGGHAPPGWYLTYQRTDITGTQRDDPKGTGLNRRISQGTYVRWAQDDEADPDLRYTTSYRYNASIPKDRAIGEPTAISFKWQMEVIPPTDPAGRSQIQIHPDGEQNGTNGCVGIQHFSDCLQIDEILCNYHALKLFVELD